MQYIKDVSTADYIKAAPWSPNPRFNVIQCDAVPWYYASAVHYKAVNYSDVTPAQYITKQYSTVMVHQRSTLQSSVVQSCYTSAVHYKAVWYSDVTAVENIRKQCSIEPGPWAPGKCKFQPRSRKGKCSHNLQGRDGFLLNSFLYCGQWGNICRHP